MSKIYLLWWDNCEGYEDHQDEVRGIFSTREKAVEFLAKSIIDKEMSKGKYSISERDLDPTGEKE